MEDAERRAQEQFAKTEKIWAEAESLMRELMQSDLGTETYHIGLNVIEALTQGMRESKEATNVLSSELKAMRLASKIPVPVASKLSLGQTRPRRYEDDEERATRRQRTTSPMPQRSTEREHDATVSAVLSSILGEQFWVLTNDNTHLRRLASSCATSLKHSTNSVRIRKRRRFGKADFPSLRCDSQFRGPRPSSQTLTQMPPRHHLTAGIKIREQARRTNSLDSHQR